MPLCHYWIVTYHPNPIREDRVSIGVIASDDLTVGCRFISDPQELPINQHPKYLAEGIRDLEKTIQNLNTPNNPAPPYNQIEQYRAHLNNTYQLTAPRIASSASGVGEAAEDLYRAFVAPE